MSNWSKAGVKEWPILRMSDVKLVGKLTAILNLLRRELAGMKISSSTPTLVPKGKVGWGEVASLWIGVNHYCLLLGMMCHKWRRKYDGSPKI